ncbi:MAG: cytochrome c oxidase subunit 3 [Cellulophaga sp.]
MNLVQEDYKVKSDRAKKMMLWFGIVSLIMSFAGWTSAYIVSRSREDWLSDIELPSSFFISTILIICSSITYMVAKKAINNNNRQLCSIGLLITFCLGIVFIVMQFNGFSQMLSNGYYFTGPTSSIKMSYVFLIAAVHILHVVAGLISLIVVFYNHLRNKYTSEEMVGFEIGATFWHFLGVLWIYLILFMHFVR